MIVELVCSLMLSVGDKEVAVYNRQTHTSHTFTGIHTGTLVEIRKYCSQQEIQNTGDNPSFFFQGKISCLCIYMIMDISVELTAFCDVAASCPVAVKSREKLYKYTHYYNTQYNVGTHQVFLRHPVVSLDYLE